MSALFTCMLLYWAVISALSVVICIYDKIAAKLFPTTRTPELILFFLSAIGGGAAMYLTMLIIHHKTKHRSFMVGIPLIILLHVILLAVLFFFFGHRLLPALFSNIS